MIWISRGRGGWALWTLLLCIAVPFFVCDWLHLLPADNSPAAHYFFYSLLLAAGLIVTPLGFSLNRGPGYWRIDPASGLKYFDKSANHSMYFIPMQYWGLLYLLAAITLMALEALKVFKAA